MRVKPGAIKQWHLHREAIDAREKDDIRLVYSIDVELTQDEQKIVAKLRNKQNKVQLIEKSAPCSQVIYHAKTRPIIVGFGPAGMFAALKLAEAGLRPLIIERGAQVGKRLKTVEQFWQKGILDPDSNVQFGEGGAGTFSDGKLNTRIKSIYIVEILHELVELGANEDILYKAKPHVGTDILIQVVQNLRKKIIGLGGEILFEHTLTDIKYKHNQLQAIEVTGAKGSYWIDCDYCILAVGHSARDTVEMLNQKI